MTTAPESRKGMQMISSEGLGRLEQFLALASSEERMPTAIVHPCDVVSLTSAVELSNMGLIKPILVGPRHKIETVAAMSGLCLDGFEIEGVEHSHAAAEKAVQLAGRGKVQALMKGSLHTDELLSAIVAPGSALKTDRRLSHAYLMDVPSYHKLMVVTDAAINIDPTLDQKRDICQNAIDLLHAFGITRPRVAALAAVETVNTKMTATIDAAALSIMSVRGQITGAVVDGPLAFDNAIDTRAALVKGIASPVAGHADILLVPNLEAGNMLAKQLIYLAGANAAGVVLGARVPVILTSRADPSNVRTSSAAIAKLLVMKRQSGTDAVGEIPAQWAFQFERDINLRRPMSAQSRRDLIPAPAQT